MTTPTIAAQRQAIKKTLGKLTIDQRRRLLSQMVPRMPGSYVPHTPHPTQQVFLKLHNLEAFFGGGGGGGKSDALLMAALQYIDVPKYSALILRRTYADLVLPGAIMDRAGEWLRGTDARPKDGGVSWVFPSGARITFGYLQRDADKYRYASAEFQYIAFDELSQFPDEKTYAFLFSRLRKPKLRCMVCGVRIYHTANGIGWAHDPRNNQSDGHCFAALPDAEAIAEYGAARDGTTLFDVPLRMRSASNPGGIGTDWVKSRFVDPETRKPGTIFVPSLLDDNPTLSAEDYRSSLEHLHPVDRERLLNGDWDVQEESGFFRREWWNYTEKPPLQQKVRHWDLASTADGGDYTVGTLMTRDGNRSYVVDVVRGQWSPSQVEDIVAATAKQDGRDCFVTMEQEPGASGASLIDHYSRTVVADYPFEAIRPSGSKVARATPLAISAERGQVFVKPAEWNRDWINEMSVFPNGNHDDQVDSVSGAYNFLAELYSSKMIV